VGIYRKAPLPNAARPVVLQAAGAIKIKSTGMALTGGGHQKKMVRQNPYWCQKVCWVR